jgi:hypothetical protein
VEAQICVEQIIDRQTPFFIKAPQYNVRVICLVTTYLWLLAPCKYIPSSTIGIPTCCSIKFVKQLHLAWWDSTLFRVTSIQQISSVNIGGIHKYSNNSLEKQHWLFSRSRVKYIKQMGSFKFCKKISILFVFFIP